MGLDCLLIWNCVVNFVNTLCHSISTLVNAKINMIGFGIISWREKANAGVLVKLLSNMCNIWIMIQVLLQWLLIATLLEPFHLLKLLVLFILPFKLLIQLRLLYRHGPLNCLNLHRIAEISRTLNHLLIACSEIVLFKMYIVFLLLSIENRLCQITYSLMLANFACLLFSFL